MDMDFMFYGGPSIELEFVASAESATDTSTPVTFSSVSLGDAADDRDIIVCLYAVFGVSSGAVTIDTLTVGGDSATIIAQEYIVMGGPARTIVSCMARVRKTTGTSGDIVFSFSGTGTFQSRAQAISVYRMTGHSDGVQSDFDTDITGDPTQTSVDVPFGGVVIGMSSVYEGAGAGSATWTGATEDLDDTVDGFLGYSSASESFASPQTGLSVDANWSGTPLEAIGITASWG